MVPQIPDNFIDDLLNRVDIRDLIGRYVTLKRVGSRYMGVCPFHGDKDPSLSITPDKGLWYCFGCHEGGNAISFIKKKENLDFADAVRFLAQLYNIQVPETASDPGAVRRRTLFDVNDRARDWYVKILKSKAGRPFREYLSRRGFKRETVIAFRVGASFQSWDFISKKLLADDFKEEELIKAGLASQSKVGGIVDRFRGRLMIPIIDTLERTVGFGARDGGRLAEIYQLPGESDFPEKQDPLRVEPGQGGLPSDRNSCGHGGLYRRHARSSGGCEELLCGHGYGPHKGPYSHLEPFCG